jgi:hypothetical protein
MLVNLTPHAVVLLVEDRRGQVIGTLGYGRDKVERWFRPVIEIPSQGVARVKTVTIVVGEIKVENEHFPITKTSFTKPENLPTPDGKTLFITSLITAQAAKAAGRTTEDLLVVGETVRDAEGRILGCVSLSLA